MYTKKASTFFNLQVEVVMVEVVVIVEVVVMVEVMVEVMMRQELVVVRMEMMIQPQQPQLANKTRG